MYFWLIGSINPFLFFVLPKYFRNKKNFLLVLLASILSFDLFFSQKTKMIPIGELNLSHFLIFFSETAIVEKKEEIVERSATSAIELGQTISSSNIISIHFNSDLTALGDWLKRLAGKVNELPEKLFFCLHLSGIKGQVQDIVLRFYIFRGLFFCLLLPVYYFIRVLGLKAFKVIKFLRFLSFVLTTLVLAQGHQSFGLVRVVLWVGPLAMIAGSLGLFGLRSVMFKCLCLSFLFPGIFSEKLGLVLWTIFSGIYLLSTLRLGALSEFFAINFLIAVIFAISSGVFGIFGILFSPLLESLGILLAVSQFFGVDSVIESFIPMAAASICESRWFYGAVITDQFYVEFLFRVLASLFLLFFCPKDRSPLGVVCE